MPGPSDPDELAAWLRLLAAPGVGAVTARQLLQAFGPPQQILAAGYANLRRVAGETAAAALTREPDAATRTLIDRTLQWLADPRHACIALGEPDYPAALLATADPPPLLYAAGRIDLLAAPRKLAMVGARNPTAQGERDARAFARAFSAAGVCIVSGFALGIDAASHAGALDALQADALAGSTIAVLGTGCDRVYPARHRDLAHRIAAQGLLLSEFALGTPPARGNFPRRNRLISGLASGVLVVEAAVHSGSLITARLAGEQGREVFALPGSIHNPLAHGCHRLIREGAKLVETAADVLEEFGWNVPAPAAPGAAPAADPAVSAEPAATDDADDDVLRALGFDVLGFDELAARTGWSADRLGARLLDLELQGAVSRLPGGRFQRIARG